MVDLGHAPLSNAYLTESDLARPEASFPLKLMVCENCWLVQTCDFVAAETMFSQDYAYYSSTSRTWLAHAQKYAADIIQQLRLDHRSLVIEIASNDGYLLKNFVQHGVPCIGIEPTGTADTARALGIPVMQAFFNSALAEKLVQANQRADLIIGNNVFAHVPDVNDFTRAMKIALKQGGTITLEFPHLLSLIKDCQFDTIYHEHFSYFSLYTVQRILLDAGLKVIDLTLLPTHGGSLRVFAAHASDPRPVADAVGQLIAVEGEAGLRDIAVYKAFQSRISIIKADFLGFLLQKKAERRLVAGYGAAAKGNTLLNYAGVKADLLPFVADAAVAKQGKYMPGSHIPILSPEVLLSKAPDYVIILPWNLAAEIKSNLHAKGLTNCKFVTAIPKLAIFEA
jgi:SAM-dependent methyltransferase